MIDAELSGVDALPEVNRSAVTGILLTGTIRILLFLAALGVVTAGFTMDAANPPASVFQNAAGFVGYKLFGIVMWAAAITSVVGAAYTSVSFFKTFHTTLERRSNYVVIAFIVFSTGVFLAFGRPVTVLIWAGTINGFILPIGLALVLLASRRTNVIGSYRHSIWLQAAGWAVVAVMTAFSVQTLINELA